MKALVTGGAGFIGSHVADALLAGGMVGRGASTTCPPGSASAFPPARVLREVDVRDGDAVRRVVERVPARRRLPPGRAGERRGLHARADPRRAGERARLDPPHAGLRGGEGGPLRVRQHRRGDLRRGARGPARRASRPSPRRPARTRARSSRPRPTWRPTGSSTAWRTPFCVTRTCTARARIRTARRESSRSSRGACSRTSRSRSTRGSRKATTAACATTSTSSDVVDANLRAARGEIAARVANVASGSSDHHARAGRAHQARHRQSRSGDRPRAAPARRPAALGAPAPRAGLEARRCRSRRASADLDWFGVKPSAEPSLHASPPAVR